MNEVKHVGWRMNMSKEEACVFVWLSHERPMDFYRADIL